MLIINIKNKNNLISLFIRGERNGQRGSTDK